MVKTLDQVRGVIDIGHKALVFLTLCNVPPFILGKSDAKIGPAVGKDPDKRLAFVDSHDLLRILTRAPDMLEPAVMVSVTAILLITYSIIHVLNVLLFS